MPLGTIHTSTSWNTESEGFPLLCTWCPDLVGRKPNREESSCCHQILPALKGGARQGQEVGRQGLKQISTTGAGVQMLTKQTANAKWNLLALSVCPSWIPCCCVRGLRVRKARTPVRLWSGKLSLSILQLLSKFSKEELIFHMLITQVTF